MPDSPPYPPQTHPKIRVVGDEMLDRYWVGSVDRISPEAPVPVLHVRRAFHRPGGAANVAVNMTAMGGTTSIVGAVGTDAAADQLRTVLEADGVSCRSLLTTAVTPTTVKTRLLAGHNQIARFDEEGFLDDASAREELIRRILAEIAAANLVVISDYSKGVCHEDVCRATIHAARSQGIPVIVDSKCRSYEMFEGATAITPNRSEAATAAGLPIRGPEDAIRAGRVLRERYGIATVVVTLGEQGMVVVTEDGVVVIPTQARQVFDVTGAGDSVVAALAVALGRGMPMTDACRHANAAGGLQVARLGTSRITWDEVLHALFHDRPRIEGKIVTATDLRLAVEQARAEGKTIGFTNGCFDIIHHGHVALLEAAARECDLLVVGVNSDASVTRLKGPPRPFTKSAERQAVLAGLASVDLVCEFDEDTPLELIRAVAPHVLVKGGDYTPESIVGADLVLARGGRVVAPLFVPQASTTGVVERIIATRPGASVRATDSPPLPAERP
jgi:D-beta-D-heptose 7-phosphate kinase/D-beta-D-heptose 1-phosphate adenosyltransferase